MEHSWVTKLVQQSGTYCSAANNSSNHGCSIYVAVTHHVYSSLTTLPPTQRARAYLFLTGTAALPIILICPEPYDELDTELKLVATRLDSSIAANNY